MIETVEAGSRLLERELGLGDLVLTQVLSIVGLPWVGVAAKQGPAHVVCWLMAAVLFHLPSHRRHRIGIDDRLLYRDVFAKGMTSR